LYELQYHKDQFVRQEFKSLSDGETPYINTWDGIKSRDFQLKALYNVKGSKGNNLQYKWSEELQSKSITWGDMSYWHHKTWYLQLLSHGLLII